jgi:ribosomal protein L25 (general stress protein Ctc)
MTSKQVEFSVETRTLGSKNANKKMRLAGKVPGIYYGKGVANIQVTMEEKGLVKILSSD